MIRLLQKALSSQDTTIDVGIAGTAMRFLTAYYALRGSEVTYWCIKNETTPD